MKKLISLLLASAILTSTTHASIYEKTDTTIITQGVTHQVVEMFNESGWIKGDVIRIDLTNEDLSLKVMTSPNGSSSLATVKTMAEAEGTKAAVNADFFNMFSGETNMLGMVYQDGELVSTPSTDNFVSFVVTEDNKVMFDYFTFKGTLYAKHTSLRDYSSCELYQVNKLPLTTGAITMITSAWGKTVSVPENCYGMICKPYDTNKYEMTGSSWGGEKVTIPENGAVFIANHSVNRFLNSNFAIGDVIEVETTITPDIPAIKEASGGNTLIVKDGKVCEFTSNIPGKAQRTAMGLSPSGKTLVLVTIDGRKEDCPGFTQTDLAEFMIALGCGTAINLDGGGSTTMVTQDRYTSEQTVQNSVSSLRKVSTAIGVISNAKPTVASQGEMKLSKSTIVTGDSVDVTTVFYDDKYNNVSFDKNKLKISCSDPYCIITGNTVMPTSAGTHTIYAEYEGIVLEEKLLVLGDIFSINIYPEVVDTTASDKSFTVTAYDKNGHSAQIPSSLITFEKTGDITLSGNSVKKGSHFGTVTAKYGPLTSVAVVNGEKHLREADIKNVDTFEGFINDGKRITITGAVKTPKTLIERLQAKSRLTHLSQSGDVYTLSDEIYDPWNIFTVYRKANGFTQRVIENTKIVTVSNSVSSSIRKSQTNAWTNLQLVFNSIQEKNLVIMTNNPIYNMNEGEQTVWDYYMDLLTKKGVNIFVVSSGEKSEVTTKNGVRYIYLGSAGDCVNDSFEYSLASSSPVTFSFSGDNIKYTFAK